MYGRGRLAENTETYYLVYNTYKGYIEAEYGTVDNFMKKFKL